MLVIFVISMLVIVAVSLKHISWTQVVLEQSHEVRSKKVSYASAMNGIAISRVLLLDKAVIEIDPYERDEIIRRFQSYAPKFILNMTHLRQLPLDNEELAIVQSIKDAADKTNDLQNQVVDFLEDDDMKMAAEFLRSNVLQKERQKQFFALQGLVEYQESLSRDALQELTLSHDDIYIFLIGASVITIIVALVVLLFMLQKILHINHEVILARDAAEASSRAKSDFVSSMSHELRTPLNAVIGFSDLLLNDKQLDDSQQRQAKEIFRAGEHLLALINDLLDMARVEAGKMEVKREDVVLADVLRRCQSMTSSYAEKYHVSYTFQCDSAQQIELFTDPLRLKQVLLNLLSNAAKYNQPGGSVTVTHQIIDDRVCRISVIDTGLGLRDDQLKRLFQRFERLDIRRDTIEGVGVGLVLSKELIELMGGTIGVKSSVGDGSTFWVDVPLSEKSDELPESSNPV